MKLKCEIEIPENYTYQEKCTATTTTERMSGFRRGRQGGSHEDR